MSQKNILVSIFSGLSVLSVLFIPKIVKALPGQQLSAFQSDRYSRLFEGRTVQSSNHQSMILGSQLRLFSTERYRTDGSPVEQRTPDLLLWVNQSGKIVFEGLVSGSNGENISINLLNNSYNPREDSEVISLIRPVWGNEVVKDFIDSKYTHSFIYRPPGALQNDNFDSRRVYVGKQYIHEIIGGKADSYPVGFLYNLYSYNKNIVEELGRPAEFEDRR
jgi:hypothetical protein